MTDVQPAIEELARVWLSAEREAIRTDNEIAAEQHARDAAVEYEAAVRGASDEELLLAWNAARALQAREDMGSVEWLQARSVSELLRAEYQASRPAPE